MAQRVGGGVGHLIFMANARKMSERAATGDRREKSLNLHPRRRPQITRH
jgi:hypothetical protein